MHREYQIFLSVYVDDFKVAVLKTDLANIDHCGTCDLKISKPIESHFKKKAIIVKSAACDINKANKEWRESKYHRIGDDIITV